MADYTIKTDGFEYECEAECLDAAIAEAFDGEGPIVDEASLHTHFAKYVDDGGWCWIEKDDDRVLETGDC